MRHSDAGKQISADNEKDHDGETESWRPRISRKYITLFCIYMDIAEVITNEGSCFPTSAKR